ncbi:ferredoxin reductase [Gordonia rhizosphera]|uniref:Putative NADPH oxidoreductase n=1 Tax=Gordonia rhizosphera NBRC 16068 TaxID=1108045 RepID=K6W450_9ACTN|nr:ferredoxin reductase [Gordonia rhizosphera]GAB93930.1 putative NADPH oxidoreductase [Gordonia rhizosphera NBRC 16068]
MGIRLPHLVGSIVEAALTPHPVDRYLELIDPMLTWRDLRAQVIAVDHPTDRTVRLTLRPTRQWTGHEAGQYVQLSVVINGVRHTRCFSPANAARPGGDLELTITAHDNGVVSTYLREHARVGMVLGLSPAMGEFRLPTERPRAAVFLNGGSGVTPVLSMVRTLVAEHYTGQITFVHYARTRADVAYRDELVALDAAHPTIDLRMHYTRGDDPDHFTAAHLADIPDLDDAHLFVCGPPALMNAVTRFHHETGMTQPLHSEAFTLAAPITIDPDAPVDGELTFLRSGRSATNDGRTILDQAESAGLSPDSGCRMGICFSCNAIKKSGCTRNVLTGETNTEADKRIQLCINAPVGDVEIEV